MIIYKYRIIIIGVFRVGIPGRVELLHARVITWPSIILVADA